MVSGSLSCAEVILLANLVLKLISDVKQLWRLDNVH